MDNVINREQLDGYDANLEAIKKRVYKHIKLSLKTKQLDEITEEGKDKPTCGICMNEFEASPEKQGQVIKMVPQCTHLFHSSCILEWVY